MALELGLGGFSAFLRRLIAGVPQLAGALVAGLVVGADVSVRAGLAVLAAYLVAGYWSARAARWRWLLPLAGALSNVAFPLIGTAGAIAALTALGEPISVRALAIAALESLVLVWFGNRVLGSHMRIRIGVIGSPAEAARLRGELERSGARDFEVAATITPDDWELDATALRAHTCARYRRSAGRWTNGGWRSSWSRTSFPASGSTSSSTARSSPGRSR